MTKERFTVTGMSCSACSAGVERVTKKLNGVKNAEVSLLGESLSVEYDEKIVTKEDIFAAVTALGYGIGEYREGKEERRKGKTEMLKKRFFISLVLLVPIMYLSMGGMLSLPLPPATVNYVLQFVLSAATIAVNFRFFKNGTSALLKRVPNMDTLVALGSGVSFLYSVYLAIHAIVMGGMHAEHLFFESAAMILTLVTLGKWLEARATGKTGKEVEKLLRMMPDTVQIEENGEEKSVPFSALKEGDILVVKQGDYIPVDGTVIEGSGYVDRAAVTGESMPVEVENGSAVTGADIVKSGYMKVKAEKVGADTTISQIVKMVKEAGESKAPIQHVADVIAGVFVPAVTFVALATFLIWFLVGKDAGTAANYGISVLVISCPCSLGLATPVAVMAATGKGMSLGVLFKNAEALQRAEKINCVLLDKTATLTEGKMRVTDFVVNGKNTSAASVPAAESGDTPTAEEKEILHIAAAIESLSNHPIADCIRAFAEEKAGESDKKVQNYVYETGKGAQGEIEGKAYRLGNDKLLTAAEAAKAKKEEKRLSAEGKTAVFLAGEEGVIAVFALADGLKETSVDAVAALKKAKIRVAMVTGDNELVARAIADKAGISDVFAGALPKDKAEAVKRVKAAGGYVAMVGDGINDSPALKEADVGIAVGTGTDVAIDSADVVLVGGDIRSVSDAIRLSKATVKNIKENLFWAFFYNVVAIPVAAGVFAKWGLSLNPMIASACMSLSSLFVVTNALRLTRFKGEKRTDYSDTNAKSGQTDGRFDGIGTIGAASEIQEDKTEKENKNNKENRMMKKTVTIEGMMCAHCVKHVTDALNAIDGVTVESVDLKKKTAVVEAADDISDEAMKNAVAEAGYEVKKIV